MAGSSGDRWEEAEPAYRYGYEMRGRPEYRQRAWADVEPEIQRDWTQPYVASPGVEAAWLVAYRDPQHHWDLYQLGEELTDLEDAFRLWRFRHLTTVQRIIGDKRGTGGTSGVGYLRQMLDVVLFPEIWTLRTAL